MMSHRMWTVVAGIALLMPSAGWSDLAVTEEVVAPSHDKRMELTVSADGLHYAYISVDALQQKAFVVHDGVEGPRLKQLQRGMKFSADGSRFAYAGRLAEAGECYVIDDETLGPYERADLNTLDFSADGKRIMYAVKAEGKWRLHLDGQPQAAYDYIAGPALLSPDGRRYAYKGKRGGKWVVVVDGKESPEYDGIAKSSPVFGPDSKRVAYHACLGEWEGGEHFLVIEGVRGPSYDQLGGLSFSPDGKRVAYWARRGPKETGKEFVVVDGEAGPEYESVLSPIFSPDSRHVAYEASAGPWEDHNHVVVVDGEEVMEGAHGLVLDLVFSSDGKHIAWPAKRDDECLVLLDGQESAAYAGIRSVVFSPDSGLLAAAVRGGALGRRKEAVLLDGQPGPQLEYVFGKSLTFIADDAVRYLGIREGNVVRITQRLVPPQ